MQIERTKIGYLVGGGLKENFRVRLIVSPQEIQEGAFVVIQSGDWNYYGIVTDIQLGATDPRFADEQSEVRYPRISPGRCYGQTLYANLEVLPNLMLEIGPEPGSPDYQDWQGMINAGLEGAPRILPVKNVPPHHAQVYLADQGDIAEIFGDPGQGQQLHHRLHPRAEPSRLHRPGEVRPALLGRVRRDRHGQVLPDAAGAGGLINYNKASVLVLDMHNEYGFDDVASDTKYAVTGLKSKFKSKVRVVGLGSGSTIRGQVPDFNLEIAANDISTSDIETLTQELNLKETTPTTLNALYASFRDTGSRTSRR
jgi:uncharacterized protein